MIEVRIDSGIETAMMMVLRQLPRNSRIISAVRQAAMTASRTTPATAALTKIDWSASGLIRSCGGSVCCTRGSMRADAVDHADRGRVAGLQDADQHAALAVLPHDVGLRREAVADGRDVAQIDGGVADRA